MVGLEKSYMAMQYQSENPPSSFSIYCFYLELELVKDKIWSSWDFYAHEKLNLINILLVEIYRVYLEIEWLQLPSYEQKLMLLL